MRPIYTFCLSALLAAGINAAVAREQNPPAAVPAADGQSQPLPPYRRSSLYTLMLDNTGLIHADVIKATFEGAPLPDKFNNHNLECRYFDPRDYAVSAEELTAAGIDPRKVGSSRFTVGKNSNQDLSPQLEKVFADNNISVEALVAAGIVTPKVSVGKKLASRFSMGLADIADTKDLPLRFEKFFAANHIARDIVAKWYNRQEDNTFNMQLIADRGSYDATELQAAIAARSVRGQSMLKDAGQELIANTFVLLMRFHYVDKAEVAQKTSSFVSRVGKILGPYGQMAGSLTNAVTTVAGKGYVVKTTAYLYKLNWNDTIQTEFESTCWDDPARFDTTRLFSLEAIGSQTSWADVQSSVFSGKSKDQLIERATIRAIDAVISKLQKKYEVFRTKTPLISTDPALTAQIGMKEGVQAGDRFEVLEQQLDPETGITTYKRKAVIKARKGMIWDNRYNAGEETAESKGKANEEPEITTFKGSGKGLYPGMLVRQIN